MLCLGAIFIGASHAQTVINISKGVVEALPIAVVPFQHADVLGVSELTVKITKDLERSSDFAVMPQSKMLSQPSNESGILWRDWRVANQQFLVLGEVTPTEDARLAVKFSLHDVLGQKELLADTVIIRDYQAASAAHYISDKIYEMVQGVKGVASTKLLYVGAYNKRTASGITRRYTLNIADIDGDNERQVLTSKEPVLSPTWSPDGSQFAYVSYEDGNSAVFVQDVASGSRDKVLAFKGINGSPSWSPQGDKLAVSLSKDGNSELYLYDLQTRSTARLTRNSSIDTEPSWFPDGQSILFTSDRGGSPQLYRLWLTSHKLERVTFKGKYNANGGVSPDGKYVIYVHRKSNGFHIVAQNIKSGSIQLISKTSMDESPSISPNGREIVFATGRVSDGALGVIALHTGKITYISTDGASVREPVWSPFLQ